MVFLGSIIGLGIAGVGLTLMVGYYGYKWYKKESINIKGETITIASALIIVGAISTYKLVESSYYYAKEGTCYVLEAGQNVISGTIKYFSVALLEGVGETYDYFKEKWTEEEIKKFDALELKILSFKREAKNEKNSLHLKLEVSNLNREPLDFKALVMHKLLLIKNESEAYYPVTFDGIHQKNMLIPPMTTVVQEIDIIVHGDNFPTMLTTPHQKLELK